MATFFAGYKFGPDGGLDDPGDWNGRHPVWGPELPAKMPGVSFNEGFSRSDLAPAFKAEIEITREERATEHSLQATRVERLVAGVAQIAIPVGLVTLVSLIFASDGDLGFGTRWYKWFAIAESVSCASTDLEPFGVRFVAPPAVLVQRRKDIDTEFWASSGWSGTRRRGPLRRCGSAAWSPLGPMRRR